MKVSPWLVYTPVAFAYSAEALAGWIIPGFTPVAFCVPVAMFRAQLCYPALPLNLITLSVFLLVSIRKWGWFAGPVVASAAVGYDLSFGGITPAILYPRQELPVLFIQLSLLILPFFILGDRIKVKVSGLLLFFVFMMSSGLFNLQNFLGASIFPFIPYLAVFCLAFDQSLIYERGRSEGHAGRGSTGESGPA